MARKSSKALVPKDRRTFDIAFEPIFKMASNGGYQHLSLSEVLLRQAYKHAWDGDVKAIKEILRIARMNDRERACQQRRVLTMEPIEARGTVPADPAMRLLDIVRPYNGAASIRLGIAPWAAERAVDLCGKPSVHGTAVHQLVTQHIEPPEQDRQDRCCVLTSQRGANGYALTLQFVLPVCETHHTVMVVPEGSEDIAIIQQHTNFLRKSLPDHVVNAVFVVEPD